MNNLIQSMLHHLPNELYQDYSDWYEKTVKERNTKEQLDLLVCLLRKIDERFYNEYYPEVQRVLRKHNTNVDKITMKLLNDAINAEDPEYEDDIEI